MRRHGYGIFDLVVLLFGLILGAGLPDPNRQNDENDALRALKAPLPKKDSAPQAPASFTPSNWRSDENSALRALRAWRWAKPAAQKSDEGPKS